MWTDIIFPFASVALVFSFKWFFSTLGKTKFDLKDFDYGVQLYIAALLLYVRFLLKTLEGKDLWETAIPAIHFIYFFTFLFGWFLIARVILGLKAEIEAKANEEISDEIKSQNKDTLIVLIPLIVGIFVLFFVSSIIQ